MFDEAHDLVYFLPAEFPGVSILLNRGELNERAESLRAVGGDQVAKREIENKFLYAALDV
jgi:hypothetical protein